jgi:hypothetical protein
MLSGHGNGYLNDSIAFAISLVLIVPVFVLTVASLLQEPLRVRATAARVRVATVGNRDEPRRFRDRALTRGLGRTMAHARSALPETAVSRCSSRQLWRIL